MQIILVLIILVGIFSAGVFVGLEKAQFSYRFGENYVRNFVGNPKNFSPLPQDREFTSGRGAVGQIVKIDNCLLTLKSPDGT